MREDSDWRLRSLDDEDGQSWIHICWNSEYSKVSLQLTEEPEYQKDEASNLPIKNSKKAYTIMLEPEHALELFQRAVAQLKITMEECHGRENNASTDK